MQFDASHRKSADPKVAVDSAFGPIDLLDSASTASSRSRPCCCSFERDAVEHLLPGAAALNPPLPIRHYDKGLSRPAFGHG